MATPISIDRVGPDANAVLLNLFELYLHDMSTWFRIDVDAAGRFGYDLAPRWAAGDPVYLAWVDGALAGFAVIAWADAWLERPDVRDMRELFVLRRYRSLGVGAALAQRAFDDHPGEWLVRVLEDNAPALGFWRKVVRDYTRDSYSERIVTPDGRNRIFFSFESAPRRSSG